MVEESGGVGAGPVEDDRAARMAGGVLRDVVDHPVEGHPGVVVGAVLLELGQ